MAWPRMVFNKAEGKRTLIVFGCIGLFLFSYLGLALFYLVQLDIGYQEKSVSWLPEEATNVSYYEHHMFRAYEFEISERGFREWAPHGDELQEITKPVKVWRFVHGLKYDQPRREALGVPPDEPEEHTATRGLFYYEEARNGGIFMVVYDRDTGKAYRVSTPR